LGRTEIEISQLCIGCMQAFGWASFDPARFVTTIRHAVDMGLNFLDTAAAYGDGYSEEPVSKAITGRRGQVVIATKLILTTVARRMCALVWSSRCAV
jgi:aryl-alcohol dehydrogenase-like predicted oxidoreductase